MPFAVEIEQLSDEAAVKQKRAVVHPSRAWTESRRDAAQLSRTAVAIGRKTGWT